MPATATATASALDDRPFGAEMTREQCQTPRRGASGVSRKEELTERIADAMARLASIYCAEGESLSQLRQRCANLCERDLGRVAIWLDQAANALDGDALDHRGWTWRLWGSRSHWLDKPDRTACGRTWRGGLVQELPHKHGCRACARVLAARWRRSVTMPEGTGR